MKQLAVVGITKGNKQKDGLINVDHLFVIPRREAGGGIRRSR